MWEHLENTKVKKRRRYGRRSVTFGNMEKKKSYIEEMESQRAEIIRLILHRATLDFV